MYNWSQERGDKDLRAEAIFKEIMAGNSLILMKDINTLIQSLSEPKEDKQEEKHTKTHLSWTTDDQRQRENLKGI